MDQHLIAISSSLSHLTSLSLCHCVALSDMSVMQLITASSPYLRRIDLTECRLLTDLTVQLIAHLCSQLEDISLQGCGLITDDAIEQLAYYCTRLQKVNISQCNTISDKGLLTLLQSSGRMTHLDPTSKARTRNARLTKLGVAGCSGITLSGLLSIADHLTISEMGDGNHSSLVSLEFTCPALKKFSNNIQNGNISVTAATPFTTNTTSPATRLFQTLPPNLQDIIIHDSFMLSHDDVICLVDRVGPSLKTLRLDNANAIDSETITHILAVCPNLTVLCIPRATRLDDSGVIQFTKAKCSQSLVELDLSACHALTDECLTKLATSRPPVSYNGDTKSLEFSKGKCVEERTTESLCLFPNLRRLDLSYNDKLTLTGIIPLVMSLKNLCALDVSFCGDGVTRSWNSSLESIRPILDLSGSDTSSQHSAVRDYGSQDEQSYDSISEEEEEAPYSPPAVSSECQSVQETVSRAVPINVPSRQGLGRYVGPLMNHSDTTSRNDTAVLQGRQYCPEQGTGSNEEVQQHRRRRSSASSMSSATSSLASYLSSSSSSSSSLSSAGSSSGSTSIESISPKLNSRRSSPYQRHRRRSPSKIILADRHDIIDSTPKRVGIPASFHLESWFTPQHQVQLQHLFQIQLQHQRDLEDQQVTSAFQGAVATHAQINPKAVASLSPEMMVHPIMSAIRPGVATFSVGSLAQQRQQQRQQLQHPASTAMDMQELNENLDRHLRLEPVGHLARVGSGVIRAGTSRRHHRQHYYRNHHIRRGSTGVTTGHCEISAWGLSKLRAEWSMV